MAENEKNQSQIHRRFLSVWLAKGFNLELLGASGRWSSRRGRLPTTRSKPSLLQPPFGFRAAEGWERLGSHTCPHPPLPDLTELLSRHFPPPPPPNRRRSHFRGRPSASAATPAAVREGKRLTTALRGRHDSGAPSRPFCPSGIADWLSGRLVPECIAWRVIEERP